MARTSVEHSTEYWKNHFEAFLGPLIEENPSLEAVRSQGLGTEVKREELGEALTSRVVVADVTDMSPNVFWELGARQAMGYDAIVIAQEGTDVPFNIGSGETLFYSNDYPRMARFIRSFTESLERLVVKADVTDGLEPPEAKGEDTYMDIFRRHETVRRLDGLIAETDANLGILRSCIEQNKGASEGGPTFFGVTEPMKVHAIDLLVTKRYLEKDAAFYQLVEDSFSGLKTYWESVYSWAGDPAQFAPWLVENGRNLESLLGDLQESLQAAADELASAK